MIILQIQNLFSRCPFYNYTFLKIELIFIYLLSFQLKNNLLLYKTYLVIKITIIYIIDYFGLDDFIYLEDSIDLDILTYLAVVGILVVVLVFDLDLKKVDQNFSLVISVDVKFQVQTYYKI